MKVLINTAGFATRLAQQTANDLMPKCLVRLTGFLDGQPALAYQLRYWAYNSDCDGICIIARKKHVQALKHFLCFYPDKELLPPVHIVEYNYAKGSGHAISYALNLLGWQGQDLFVQWGDIVLLQQFVPDNVPIVLQTDKPYVRYAFSYEYGARLIGADAKEGTVLGAYYLPKARISHNDVCDLADLLWYMSQYIGKWQPLHLAHLDFGNPNGGNARWF